MTAFKMFINCKKDAIFQKYKNVRKMCALYPKFFNVWNSIKPIFPVASMPWHEVLCHL